MRGASQRQAVAEVRLQCGIATRAGIARGSGLQVIAPSPARERIQIDQPWVVAERWLAGPRLIQAVGRGLASLPAYAILVLRAAPFGAEEVVKIYAFVLMGGGHFVSGFILYIACHIFAILVCERIYRAGEQKLMTIPWFAKLMTWLIGYKDRLVAWVNSTELYRRAMEYKSRLRQSVRLFLRRTKTALGQ